MVGYPEEISAIQIACVNVRLLDITINSCSLEIKRSDTTVWFKPKPQEFPKRISYGETAYQLIKEPDFDNTLNSIAKLVNSTL